MPSTEAIERSRRSSRKRSIRKAAGVLPVANREGHTAHLVSSKIQTKRVRCTRCAKSRSRRRRNDASEGRRSRSARFHRTGPRLLRSAPSFRWKARAGSVHVLGRATSGPAAFYELAREGKSVERRSRQVTIYGLTLLGVEPPHTGAIARGMQ